MSLREHCIWRDSPLLHSICTGAQCCRRRRRDWPLAAAESVCALPTAPPSQQRQPPHPLCLAAIALPGGSEGFLRACDATGTSLCGRWPVAAFLRLAEVRQHAAGWGGRARAVARCPAQVCWLAGAGMGQASLPRSPACRLGLARSAAGSWSCYHTRHQIFMFRVAASMASQRGLPGKAEARAGSTQPSTAALSRRPGQRSGFSGCQRGGRAELNPRLSLQTTPGLM